MNEENIKYFSKQSVLGMICLSVVTLTFYFPFWMRRTSCIINRMQPANPIGEWFFPVSITLTLLNFGMVIPEIMTNDNPTVMMISKLINIADCILILVWAFKIRNRLNLIFEAERKPVLWFSAVWTFVFQMFYIQFKINKIQAAEQRHPTDAVEPHR